MLLRLELLRRVCSTLEPLVLYPGTLPAGERERLKGISLLESKCKHKLQLLSFKRMRVQPKLARDLDNVVHRVVRVRVVKDTRARGRRPLLWFLGVTEAREQVAGKPPEQKP